MKAKALQLADKALAMEYAPRLEIAKELRRLHSENEQLKARPWVGLTKEEAKEISLANRPYVIDMIAALEARLKEKNT
jgi:hypothetical protein